jgi:hypothetical protein
VNWKFFIFSDIPFETKLPSVSTITDLLFKHKYYLYQRRKISGLIIFIMKERQEKTRVCNCNETGPASLGSRGEGQLVFNSVYLR